MSDYKAVNDRSLSDINRANRDAWDSGEFRHTDAGDGWPKPRTAEGARKAIKQEGPLTKAQQEVASKHESRPPATPGNLKGGKRLTGREVAILEHPQNDAADVRHTPEGKSLVLHGEQVVQHDKAVHLPRTKKRTWRKPSWK